jgi:hypothetical protein
VLVILRKAALGLWNGFEAKEFASQPSRDAEPAVPIATGATGPAMPVAEGKADTAAPTAVPPASLTTPSPASAAPAPATADLPAALAASSATPAGPVDEAPSTSLPQEVAAVKEPAEHVAAPAEIVIKPRMPAAARPAAALLFELD